jgi:hypothetical protein
MEALAAENGEECVAPRGSLRWNARQLLERGEPASIAVIADRLDGKALQQIEVGDPGSFDEKSDADLFAELLREAEELGVPLGETSH